MGLTWGQLAKSALDEEKVEEAIERYLQEHGNDPEAHLGASGSLQSHKASEIIDHHMHSILAEKIHESGKAFQCVVAPSGGDYETIQAAIADGKQRIYVKAGTYRISSPINIQWYGTIIKGESIEDTIIELEDYADCNVFTLGNDINNFPGISIDTLQIDGRKSNQTYGANSVGIYATRYITDLRIKNCYIHDMKKNGISIRNDSERSVVENNRVKDCDTDGIEVFLSDNVYVLDNLSNYNGNWGNAGIFIYDSADCIVRGNNAKDNDGEGIQDMGTNTEISHNIE